MCHGSADRDIKHLPRKYRRCTCCPAKISCPRTVHRRIHIVRAPGTKIGNQPAVRRLHNTPGFGGNQGLDIPRKMETAQIIKKLL